jgi:hypothetical protein
VGERVTRPLACPAASPGLSEPGSEGWSISVERAGRDAEAPARTCEVLPAAGAIKPVSLGVLVSRLVMVGTLPVARIGLLGLIVRGSSASCGSGHTTAVTVSQTQTLTATSPGGSSGGPATTGSPQADHLKVYADDPL